MGRDIYDDDANDREGAMTCRRLAVEAVNGLIAEQRENEVLPVLKADLMRRAGMFEQYRGVQLNDEMLRTPAAFELRKAEAGDAACSTVLQAENDE